jgi:hypothetical protein
MELVETVLNEGIRGACIVFLLVCSYKVFRARISTDSESHCGKCFQLHVVTENQGGQELSSL